MNRLETEKSPYLLQHAKNPVDWYPWSTEAFERAKAEHKPVFLSIGYSTCHWCHVMAHESFEDTEIAAILNQNYICIKVDREERPDIDAVYMAVCQALTGAGGWPLTIIMTPEQKPFWAGTYLPKTTRYGNIGLLDLLTIIKQKWSCDHKQLLEISEKLAAFAQPRETFSKTALEPNKQLLQHAVNLFQNAYDKRWGGFGSAPKFPAPHNLIFLLRYSFWESTPRVRDMAEYTLTQMYRGGLFDHIGGGFSRYSTDGQWKIPHFEKMLYDNALLACAYLEAYQIGHRPLFRTIAERTLDYTLRELTDEQGGFYCGQDADSDGVEGKYYAFTPGEIRNVLGRSDGTRFCEWFDITEQGNFEGKNIPNLIANRDFAEPNPQMDILCQKLYAYRLSRTLLQRDDKVLTSWNALMITALTKAGSILQRPDYLKAAQKAERFLCNHLIGRNGRLLLRWYEGDSAHDGQLDDYAYYALALLELYHVTFELSYLQRAVSLAENILALFPDQKSGGFYRNAADSQPLIGRPKEIYDGAMPSGNSVAAIVLDRLARLTGEPKWSAARDRQMCFLASTVQEYPAGYSMSLLAFMRVLYPAQELICVTADSRAPAELTEWMQKTVNLNLTVVLKSAQQQQELGQIAPYTLNYPIPEKAPLYYLCKNHVCAAPVKDVNILYKQLGNTDLITT